MNSITSGANDLGHVCPHAVPPTATKPAPEAGTLDRDIASLGLVMDGVDVFGREVRVPLTLKLRITTNFNPVRMFGGAAQATLAQPLPGSHTSYRSAVDLIDTRPAKDDLLPGGIAEYL